MRDKPLDRGDWSRESLPEDGGAEARASAEREPTHPFAAEPVSQPDLNDGPSVPGGYGADRVSAMPRGPTSLYVYWELKGPHSERVRGRPGARRRWILRVRDLKRGSFRDVPVDPEAGNHYVTLKPGGWYTVELGVGAGAAFEPVCERCECSLPLDRPQAGGQVAWTSLRPGAEEPLPGAGPRRRPNTPGVLGLAYDPARAAAGASSYSVQQGGR